LPFVQVDEEGPIASKGVNTIDQASIKVSEHELGGAQCYLVIQQAVSSPQKLQAAGDSQAVSLDEIASFVV
jgi:hypothetical protein